MSIHKKVESLVSEGFDYNEALEIIDRQEGINAYQRACSETPMKDLNNSIVRELYKLNSAKNVDIAFLF